MYHAKMPQVSKTPNSVTPRLCVWKSSPDSAERRIISVLACTETVLASAAALALAYRFDMVIHITAAVTVAPFVLLRSRESVDLAIRTLRTIDSQQYRYERRGGRYASGLLFATWGLLVLLLVRIYATIATLIRHGPRICANVPRNWRLFSLCVDSCHPPEAVAGLESYVRRHPSDTAFVQMTLASLWQRYRTGNRDRPLAMKTIRSLVYGWVFACLFVPSFLFRWSIKASSLIYLPFIYFSTDISFRGRGLKARAAAIFSARASLIWAILGVWILLTITPLIVAGLVADLRDTVAELPLLGALADYWTVIPRMERWNLVRLGCATITILMFGIAWICTRFIRHDAAFWHGRKSTALDGLLRILNMLRAAGVYYVLVCGLILAWRLLLKVRILVPEIGDLWFPQVSSP